MGFISAVAFATILAVVAGLTLSGASAVSHDIYSSVIRKGRAQPKEEMRVSRAATLGLGVLAIIFGVAFENQNVAFMVGLAFAVAASANFPVLMLSMFWKGLTTRGAVAGGFAGLIGALVLIVLGPTVWVSVLHNDSPISPTATPPCSPSRWPSPYRGSCRCSTNPNRRRRTKPASTPNTSAP